MEALKILSEKVPWEKFKRQSNAQPQKDLTTMESFSILPPPILPPREMDAFPQNADVYLPRKKSPQNELSSQSTEEVIAGTLAYTLI
jgi:hypothetical protein